MEDQIACPEKENTELREKNKTLKEENKLLLEKTKPPWDENLKESIKQQVFKEVKGILGQTHKKNVTS